MADSDAPEQPAPAPETEALPEQPEQKPTQPAPPEMTAALRKANKEAEKLRLEIKEYQDRDKSETEKLSERAAAAEQRAAEMEADLLRSRVALAKGLPASLAGRLQGSSLEEIEADADTLLGLIAPTAGQKSFPDLGQGRRDGTTKPSMELGRQMFDAKRPAKT